MTTTLSSFEEGGSVGSVLHEKVVSFVLLASLRCVQADSFQEWETLINNNTFFATPCTKLKEKKQRTASFE